MLELRHENDTGTLRMNGRKLLELREIKCQLGIMQKASGSALYEIGNTKVAAFIQGPHQYVDNLKKFLITWSIRFQQRNIKCQFFHDKFQCNRAQNRYQKRYVMQFFFPDPIYSKMKEFTRMLKSVFEQVIMLELYPKSQIDLQVFVLEQDGGYRSAAFNAVSLALMDGGIAMKDFVVATTAGLLGSVAVLDLIQQEEKKQNCEFVLVYLLKAQKISYVNLNCNKIRVTEFQKLLNMSISSCEEIANVMKKAIRSKLENNINSFYFK